MGSSSGFNNTQGQGFSRSSRGRTTHFDDDMAFNIFDQFFAQMRQNPFGGSMFNNDPFGFEDPFESDPFFSR